MTSNARVGIMFADSITSLSPQQVTPVRYLFGPASIAFANEYLAEDRHSGKCVCLGADIPCDSADTWDAIASRLPAGWKPERIVVRLSQVNLPIGLWSATVPIIGLAEDWDLLGHYYRHTFPMCDVVLADPPAATAIESMGFGRVLTADLCGLGRSALELPVGDAQDIDVLVLDDLHPAVRREGLPWVGRIAQLADSCRVVVRRPTNLAADRALLARTRFFAQLPGFGSTDRLAYEAAAAGAVLFRVPTAWDGADGLRTGIDYIPYNGQNLERIILHLLESPAEYRPVAGAGRARVREFTYSARLGLGLAAANTVRESSTERAQRRSETGAAPGLGWAAWAATLGRPLVGVPEPGGPDDRPELAVARGVIASTPVDAVRHFEQALALDPTHPVAASNLAEALAAADRAEDAVAVAKRAVQQLEVSAPRPFAAWDVPLYPLADVLARCEWERLVWLAGGNPTIEAEAKRGLLRWRLHALLARLTDDLSHYHESALARPDLATTHAALGCALARRGRVHEGLPHLKGAVAADPFDRAAARALFAALGDAKDSIGQRLFVRQQRRLVAAAAEDCPAEQWLDNAGPVGDELVSVIIVVHNQPEFTRVCLESVLRCTRPPVELILVDNGSETETSSLLADYTRRPGVGRVELLRTGKNLGYPAAANRGLAVARGEFLVLLNNDTAVTPGWIESLLERLLADWPRVGLVGPVTNAAPDPQRVPLGYTDLEDLDEFAISRRRTHVGEALEVKRLSGFCMVTSRQAYQAIGPLDEQFGIGFFEDDDWCVRARRAGYALVVALDTFVHHFGNATFRAVGADTEALLRANYEKFRAKWGEDEARPYHLPATPREKAARQTVSLCMIVRNEEHHLPDCLSSARDLVDEMVVVDTGSTDRTKEIAAGFSAKVFDFPWVDSFSAARNESIRHATGDWVFWLDADDRLGHDDREKLRRLLGSLRDELAAYVMKCRCVSDTPGASETVVDHVRLFRNDPRLRWRYRVHEQILPALREVGADVRWSDVAITHLGYAEPGARGPKLERDLRLLRLEETEQPDDPFTLFNLGSVMLELRQTEEALPYLLRSLTRSHPRDSIVRKLHAQIAQCHHRAGRQEEALRACAAGREHYPDDAELLFVEGLVRQDGGDWEGAAGCWRRLVDGRDGYHFASVDAGLRGYKSRHNLALAYFQLGRPVEAEEQWRHAAEECPSFVPAWVGLGRMGTARGDRALVALAVARLEALGETGQMEVAELRAWLTSGSAIPEA
ncbi:MAG: glycosyltransferase [Planctomycetia bacterium]|nr:glycosyltransferase [Planctomycetia bacterium]